jgi:hypothetical protein
MTLSKKKANYFDLGLFSFFLELWNFFFSTDIIIENSHNLTHMRTQLSRHGIKETSEKTDKLTTMMISQKPYTRPETMTPAKIDMPNHVNANAAELYRHGRSIV